MPRKGTRLTQGNPAPQKITSKKFNAAVQKNGELLWNICRARAILDRSPALPEKIYAIDKVRAACEILERRIGTVSNSTDTVSAGKTVFGDSIKKDKSTYPVINTEEAERSELYATKKTNMAFGMLDALLNFDESGNFALAKISNKHRLKICQDAKENLETAVLMDLRSLRAPPSPAVQRPLRK